MNIFLSDSWELSGQAEGRQAIEATGRGCAKVTKVEVSNDTESQELTLWKYATQGRQLRGMM